MPTAYVYTPLGWVSGSAPKITAANLNHMDAGIQQGAHITGLESDRTTALATANPGALMFCTDSQILYLSLGTSWQFVHARPVVVSALPASPVDGQEIDYVADAANGVRWRFRYNAGSSSTYKWEYVGGGALYATDILNDDSTGSATYIALTNAGPSLTVPLAGDYEVQHGSGTYATGAGNLYHSYDIGATGAVDADSVQTNPGSAILMAGSRTRRKNGLAASTALVSKYRSSSTSIAGHFFNRWMKATPIRVG